MDIYAIFVMLSILSRVKTENYIPTSTSGNFYAELKYAGLCEDNKVGKNLIQYNMKAIRTANGKKYLFGNITHLIPFDDTIKATFRLDKFSSSTGRYQANYFQIRLDHVCSDSVRYMGAGWTNFQKAIKMPVTCPVPEGVYPVNAYDLNLFFDKRTSALPATFFYGRYKMFIIHEKSNEVLGCHYEIVECKPSWQHQNKTFS